MQNEAQLTTNVLQIIQAYYDIKSLADRPVALAHFTVRKPNYRQNDNHSHELDPFRAISVDFTQDDLTNIANMLLEQANWGNQFWFFNNSPKGRRFWEEEVSDMTVVSKDDTL